MPQSKSPLSLFDCDLDNDKRHNIAFYDKDPALGDYALTAEAINQIKSDEKIRVAVASVIASKRAIGISNPFLIYAEPSAPTVTLGDTWITSSIESLESEYPRSTSELFKFALWNLSNLSQHAADTFWISNESIYLVGAVSRDALDFIISEFKESGYIKSVAQDVRGTQTIRGYRLSVKGWETVNQIRSANRRGRPSEAFVAMWFDPSMDIFYTDGITKALTQLGIKPVQIDLVQHNDKICDRIISAIRRCDFLIADFTGSRGGVYFEAGFAAGLGKPVIWAAKDGTDLHFDTRQYNHILYNTPSELHQRLVDRIGATILM